MSRDKNFNFKIYDGPHSFKEGDISYYKNAINHYSNLKNVKMTCEMLFKLGHAYKNKKQYKKAKNSYHISRKLCEEENDFEGEAKSLEAIGDLSKAYNDLSGAISNYKLSLKKYNQATNEKKEIRVAEKIASSYDAIGSYDDAQRYYKKAISLGAQDKTQNSLKNLQNKIAKLKPDTKQIIILLGIALALLFSEIVTAFYSVQTGLIINGIILISLIIVSSIYKSNFSNLLRSMIILPLIRIIGVSMPIMKIDSLYWFPIIAVPLFAATYILMSGQNMTRQSVGLVLGNLKVQIPIIFTGVIFGTIEYFILKPEPLISSLSIFSLIFAGIIILISTGFAEELIFRGILQKSAANVMGKYWAILYVSVLFSILHMGWMSIFDLIFVFFVAIFYGFIFQKTQSIFGISFSHGLTNIFLFIIIPFLI